MSLRVNPCLVLSVATARCLCVCPRSKGRCARHTLPALAGAAFDSFPLRTEKSEKRGIAASPFFRLFFGYGDFGCALRPRRVLCGWTSVDGYQFPVLSWESASISVHRRLGSFCQPSICAFAWSVYRIALVAPVVKPPSTRRIWPVM